MPEENKNPDSEINSKKANSKKANPANAEIPVIPETGKETQVNSTQAQPEIQERLIEMEMEKKYIDYAMSVITSRALPDVRDGLKPVHRRVLYTMWENQQHHNKPFKKSANTVGTCMAKYHPHGDMAIYDTLVRMAQPFSLRYPLIQGQGNFGCFTADTKVKLTDGRNLSFKEIVEEHKKGKRNFTFTIDKNGKIIIAEIKNPRITKKDAEVIKIILDNGEEIKCTPNHKFMMKDGNYLEAEKLMSGNSLMPSYFRLSVKEDDPNAIGYSMVFQPKSEKWEFVHILSDEQNLKNKLYDKSTGRIRHHINFNKLNNNPDNIKRMNWKEHWQTHYNFTSTKHKNDEDYRKKLAEGRKKFWSNPANREISSKRLSERNLKNWKNEEYRKKRSKSLSEININYLKKHPERIEEIRKTASKTMKKMWQILKYKQLFHEKIVASNKNRKTNLTGKKKFLNVCSFLKNKNIIINQENYEKIRKQSFGRGFTSWELAVKKYYNNDENLLFCEINKNHKIAKVEFLNEFADVYDLTIEETHNFALASGVFVHNSIDGDSAAAQRYTEARLSKISEELLIDIDKETTDTAPNFDNTAREPVVLPAKLPNLLINGSSGIAVGMATNIPPHNISEVIDAIILLLENPNLTVEILMEKIKSPDFPTGAYLLSTAGIAEAYKTGRGKLILRAKTHLEPKKIIVTEIPYQVNKSVLISEIAELVRNRRIEGIRDIRDESDKQGIRIVFELRESANPEIVQNNLFKLSQLQTTFGVIMLALVDNQPRVLNLKQILRCYILHRKEVITRRTQFELKKSEQRAHLLEGIKIALINIDTFISIIKSSDTPETAKRILINRYRISDSQADAVLDMKLQRLTSLETRKVEEEHDALAKLILELKSILASEQEIIGIIKKELLELRENYSDERKTQIMHAGAEIQTEELIREKDVVITVSHDGYIKQTPLETYKLQNRGGKGIVAAETKDTDFIEGMFITSNHSYLLFFTNLGKVHLLKAYEIPEASRYSKGKAIVNMLNLRENEKIATVLPVREFAEKYVFFATKHGIVKKTALSNFANPRKGGIQAITLKEKDELINALLTSGSDILFIATKLGSAVRFKESDVREMARNASGVRGVMLCQNDELVGIEPAKDTILTVTEQGYGKRTNADEYRLIRRGGSGVINIKLEKNNNVVGIKSVSENDEIMLITKNGILIRIKASQISAIGRNTQGVRIIRLKEPDKLIAVAKVVQNGDTAPIKEQN